MAKYLKAAGGNWSAAATWSATGSGGADNAGAPAASDDVVLQVGSGNCTIDAASVCRSLDASAYGAGKTLTHNAFILTIGDATAGAGNKALDFSGGFTYTLANATTSAITFVSTSTTQQAVNGGSKTFGNVTFNGANGTWQLTGVMNTGATATVTVTTGRLDWNNQNCSWGMYSMNGSATRRLTPGSTTSITLTGTSSACNFGSVTGLTVDANTATITCNGTLATNQSAFTSGATNFNGLSLVLAGTGAQAGIISSSAGITLANLTRTGTAVKTDSLRFAGSLTITGTFTCTGNSAINRVLVYANTVGTPITITAAAISVDNTDFQDITGAGAATWDMSAVSSGNCGGNSMKALGTAAFTTSATQTATGTSSFTWSTHGWTSRVPLPQDDVIINNSFSASQTITADMPRLGRSITFSCTGNPALSLATNNAIYGVITLASGMTTTNASSNLNFSGSGTTCGITTNGVQIAGASNLSMFGTFDFNDDCYVVGNLTCANGTINTNNHDINVNFFNTNTAVAKTINAGSSTITSRGARSTIWDFGGTGLTWNAGTSTVVISDTSAIQKIFAGNGKTFYNVTISGRNVLITGSNTFNVLSDNTAGLAEGLYLTAGTTQTVNSFLTNGSAGNLAKLRSSTSGLYGGGITLNGTDMAYSAVDHADFKPAGNFSVMAVFRTSTLATYKCIFQSYSKNTNIAGIQLFIINNNKLEILSGKNTGTAAADYKVLDSTATTYCDGARHKVIATYDGTKLHLYIDGTEDGTGVAWTNAAAFAATNYIRIGNSSDAGANQNWFPGMIDEVALWNGTALTAANVTTLQSSQLADSAALLASSTVYYKFSIGAETTDTDAGAHTLTAIGTPTLTTNGKIAKPTKHNTVDYMDIADTTFQGGTKWYASTHSTDSGGNTGIAFSAEVPDGKGFFRLVR